MQERLIELGYLKGKADGVFGDRTRGAVERFQKYNGLDRDGVAGKRTLTMLFESDQIVAAVTATPSSASVEAIPTPGVDMLPGVYLNGSSEPLWNVAVFKMDGGRVMLPVKALLEAAGALEAESLDQLAGTLSGTVGEHQIKIVYSLDSNGQLDMAELEADGSSVDLTEEMVYYQDGAFYLSPEGMALALNGES